MTRTSLRSTLRRLYLVLGLLLAISLAAKLRGLIPGVPGTRVDVALAETYEYFRDMSLLIATGGVAYLTNMFQKRSTFVESLEREWYGIVRTKSALYAYCEKQYASVDDYVAAFCRISETIDNMRVVYRNVGETDALVGLYPYAPLHDMRRALQSIDPRKRSDVTAEEKKLARDAILQAFYALRENFLEELDIREPQHPILISGARRLRQPGATRGARTDQDAQLRVREKDPPARADIDAFLGRLYAAEQNAQARRASEPRAA